MPLLLEEEGKRLHVSDSGRITLTGKDINGKPFKKDLGVFNSKNPPNKRSYYKWEKEKDTYRAIEDNVEGPWKDYKGSWSIHYEIFKMIEGTINIKSELAIYRIDIETAKKVGVFLHHKTSGIETKIYIKKSDFQQLGIVKKLPEEGPKLF